MLEAKIEPRSYFGEPAFVPFASSAVQKSYNDGNVASRSWANGTAQTLTWDAFNRLIKVSQRDGSNNGYDWTAVYDGLGRRLSTSQQPVVNNSANGAATVTASTYDPQVEFLEIGVSVNGAKAWKVYGPDLNERFGGMQGVGGLEAVVQDSGGSATGVLNDYFGNGVATITGTGSSASVSWNTTHVGAYGPLPSNAAQPLTSAAQLAQSVGWRGHYIDPTGFYNLGARYYDPTSGRFLSADPLGQAASMSLYDFCKGDPVNFFDPTGRDPDPIEEQDFQNRVRAGDPSAVRAVANEGLEQYVNGDFTAYVEGQTQRAQATAAVTIDAAGLAVAGGVPAEGVAAAPTASEVLAATGQSVVVNATIGGGTTYATNQIEGRSEPILPAFVGGAVTGLVLGPANAYAPSLSFGGKWGLNVTAGFAANFAGNSATQILTNNGFSNYDSSQSLLSGTFGAFLNPVEANLGTFAEGSFSKELTESLEYKYAQDYTMTTGDTILQSLLAPLFSYNGSNNTNGAKGHCPQSQ